MIIAVDNSNIFEAATIHSISWKESHRSFCSPEFVEQHTPEHQQIYLRNKLTDGSRFYILVEEMPTGIVSVTGNLIADLYVLPDRQKMGYGTKLLRYAIEKCTDIPVLWILENNVKAERLYRRMGFKQTGRIHSVADGLDEIEFILA